MNTSINIQRQNFIIVPAQQQSFDKLEIVRTECDERKHRTTVWMNNELVKVVFSGEEHDNLPTNWTNEQILDLCAKKLNVIKVE